MADRYTVRSDPVSELLPGQRTVVPHADGSRKPYSTQVVLGEMSFSYMPPICGNGDM